VFNSVLVVVCLGSAWALGFYERQMGAIPRIPLQAVLDRQDDPTKPVNFLLVGSDTTGNGPAVEGDTADRRGVFHADSISILRVDPTQRRAALLSLPRDLWVAIPGMSGTHKINAALAYANPPGSPELLMRTLKERFDIPVHHYVQVDFAAFRSLVDQLDGVNLWFDRPARDEESGLYMDEAGCQHLNGDQALAYARGRHYTERQDDGNWKVDPTSDIGRIARQQYFLKQAAKKAIARGARNPIELASLIGIAQERRYVQIDDTLSLQAILDLVANFNAFNPEDLPVSQPFTEPLNRPGPGGAGLRLLEGPSKPIFEQFREAADLPVVPLASPGEAPPGAPGPTTTPAPLPAVPPASPAPPPPEERSFVPHPPPDVAC
jgi:polyisoprenyl-teichoic acid--peptidoglycan teichoic acid transferase